MRARLLLGLIVTLAGLAAAGISTASHAVSAATGANCAQLNVTGTWTTIQSNVYHVTWHFTQKGTAITGTAVLPAEDAANGGYTGTVGHVTGSIKGSHLDVTVTWPPHTDGKISHGRYAGTVTEGPGSRGGHVTDGQAWDLVNPSTKASWTGSGAATCGASSAQPVKIDITFHANNLPTEPPFDGGQCPAAKDAARVTGQINAQISENDGKPQGGGNVVDTPHLSKCRVPAIKIAVDDITVDVVTPGKVVRATLTVHIDAEGVHRPGQCVVGTVGTITATYDDTTTAANALRSHTLQIGPWQSPCAAHTHLITNNISSITADASSSTWVRVNIACKGENTGFSPRNCV